MSSMRCTATLKYGPKTVWLLNIVLPYFLIGPFHLYFITLTNVVTPVANLKKQVQFKRVSEYSIT